MKRLAVFASGRGSNFKAIISHEKLRVLQNVQVSLLITNDPDAAASSIAEQNSIPHVYLEGTWRRKFSNKNEREMARERFDRGALEVLKKFRIDVIALAGFMQVLGPTIVRAYPNAVMNIHPATNLMKFGGPGMFGNRVHEAVLREGEKESGCTVHYADESVDGGPVILQSIVPVETTDTPETLAERILVQEHRTYSKALQLHVDDRISVKEHRAIVDYSGGWEEGWNRRQEAFIQYQTGRPTNSGELLAQSI
ncbi:MAG TPA: phosphoribosylglycinamide formyltransferase [Terriglobales bacterium]|nr:phosphoribosylglycinamide formyltransferase [Terriglobales bacterium]